MVAFGETAAAVADEVVVFAGEAAVVAVVYAAGWPFDHGLWASAAFCCHRTRQTHLPCAQELCLKPQLEDKM